MEYTRLLTESKASWYVSFQGNSTSFFSRSWRVAVKEEREHKGRQVFYHANELLQLRRHLWVWHVVNGSDLGGVQVCAILFIDAAKKFD